jgi:hypothetical protein
MCVVEVDAMPGSHVCSASLTGVSGTSVPFSKQLTPTG